jgi:uncharacterized BrkB/YihY/UPF0761 family membrane protein
VALLGGHPDTSDSVLDTVAAPTDLLSGHDALAIALLVAGVAGTALLSWTNLRALRRIAAAPAGDGERARPAEMARTTVARIAVANLLVVAALCVLATGRAGALGEALEIGDVTVLAWEIAKWPVLVVLVTGLMTVVRRAVWMSPPVWRSVKTGQVVAAGAWCAAITGFVIYLASLDSFKEAYGGVGTGVVLVMWLTLFSVLYHATPDLRMPELGAGAPAAAAAAVAWLATSGALAIWVAAFDQITVAFWGPGAVAILVVGLWVANRALLRRVRVSSAGEQRSSLADRVDLVVAPSAALRNVTAQGRMMSILGPQAHGMSDREVDMMDWGFAYGVAWAVARGQDQDAPEEVVSERALHATQAVFQAYRGSFTPATTELRAAERSGASNGAPPGTNGGPALRVER